MGQRSNKLFSAMLVGITSAGYTFYTSAAGLGQQSSRIEEVHVTGEKSGDLTAVSMADALENLKQVPGAIGFVTAEDFSGNFTQSIGDTLVFIPGVFADTSAQRENRISIRGSGLNATFERRGLTVLRDGVPISRASGATEFQEIDPLSIQYIEVYKGANGLRYGASSLGGAINIVTPTGRTTEAGTHLRLEGGSFGSFRSSVNTAGQSDNIDWYGSVTKLDSDGFREHAEVDSLYSFGNVGISINENIGTRFYVTALQDNFELAGSVSREDALSNPKASPSSNIDNDQDRNLDVYRLSNRTAFAFDTFDIETGFWYAKRTLDHAITPFVGVIDQSESEWGLSGQIQGDAKLLEQEYNWVFGFSHAESDNEAKVFQNLAGRNGGRTSEDDQRAKNTVVYGQIDIMLSNTWNLIIGSNWVDSERENRNIFALPNRFTGEIEDDSGKLSFDNFSGRIGLLWSPSDNIQYFANISEGYEPPGITDLTSGGAQPFTRLEAQESVTYEIGSRGQYGGFSWDVTAYHSQIDNEFIDVQNPFAPVTNTDNAVSDTVHQGLELGLDSVLLTAESSPIEIVWRNILTINDFKFDGDPVYGDNTLAGVPEMIYVTELKLDYHDLWYAGLNYRHIPNGAFVDYENTDKTPGFQLVGLTAGWKINDSFKLFGSVENITDEKFISNISTVADLPQQRSQNVYTPGEGRAAYLGATFSF